MAQAAGSGTVRRFWLTINDRCPKMLRSLVLRMYWDGEDKPAVEAPLGDFFCMPLGQMVQLENAWFDSAEGRSFNCRIPMPFRSGFRMTITNEGSDNLSLLFYDVNFTLGDSHGDNIGYFHAHWRRENPTQLGKDFEILPRVTGRGRFLGCNFGLAIDSKKYGDTWWGEGEVKMYLDGDAQYPTLCGTGAEDYAATAWGQERFCNQWHGCPLLDKEKEYFGTYRLHGPDPIYFHHDVRVTIQQIGGGFAPRLADILEASGEETLQVTDDGGRAMTAAELRAEKDRHFLFERQEDWSATAYFYLDKPVSELPAIVDVEEGRS